MVRATKKDECQSLARMARRLQDNAQTAGRADLAKEASRAGSDFANASECLLSSSVADKRTDGGSSEGWALRNEAKALMKRGNERLDMVMNDLREWRHEQRTADWYAR